ncbi:tryptamine:oxygen oxidoreductase (deaminating) [Mactra antiquata]
MEEEQVEKPINGHEFRMEEPTNTEKYKRIIKIGAFVILVLCIAVVVLLIVLVVQSSQDSKPSTKSASKMESCLSRDNNINLDPPEVLPPFHDLTKDEIFSIQEFLYIQPDLKLARPDSIAGNKSYIFTMELEIPKKAETLNFLDNGGPAPVREAHVVVFRGDKPEPAVEEFVVGPLPNPNYKNLVRTAPFLYRPLTATEYIAGTLILTHQVQVLVGNIIQESYGGSLMECGNTCVAFQTISSMSPVSSGDQKARKLWFWLHPVVEFSISHPYDFLILLDVTSTKWEEYLIDSVYYGGQKFSSLNELKIRYESGAIKKTRIPYPVNDRNLYSSMNRRGKLFPEVPLPPPREFEPMGKRYSINGRHIRYMNWDFDVRLSSTYGPQLFDIKHGDKRIVYELSLQDIAVFYSADSPAVRFADYVDSIGSIGSKVRSLVPGADCPTHSTFLSADHFTEYKNDPFHVERAFCVFEHNTGKPLRRHLTSSDGKNKFYEGMADTVLTIRTIATILNYDYIIDFTFHQNGAVEVTATSTGYIVTTNHFLPEEDYGFRLRDQLIGNLHFHLFNFKVDMDIHGTSNRFETIEVVPVEVNNTLWSSTDGALYSQTKMARHQVQTETEAAMKYNFDKPKYLTFYNDGTKSDFGVPRAYRLFHRGMAKQMFPEGKGQEPSISWARYQVAVTKYKENEKRSSSMYGTWDAADPVVNFQKFIDDNETITDEDQVVWVTMGVHHIPHMEDFPVTPTVGLDLSFFLLPYNYFDEDPAMGSSDAIRIEPKNQNNITEGLTIFRYGIPENSQCVPRETNFDEDVQRNPSSLFDQ